MILSKLISAMKYLFRLWPTKAQWKKWSLSSKLTAIGAYAGIVGILLTIVTFLISDQPENERSTQDLILSPKGAGQTHLRARPDYENQYLEFEASATVDMQEMKNNVQAELMAQSAAELRAYAEAAKFISGAMVGAIYDAENTLAKDENVTGKVEKTLIQYARKVDDKVEWRDNTPIATTKIGILFQNKNGLIDMVIPLLNEHAQQFGICQYEPLVMHRQGVKYTGLIVDAHGLNFSPSIAPMILTGSDNRQVYSSLEVSRTSAIERGLVGYYKSIELAKRDTARIGNNPLLVKGIKTVINSYHIWIRENDALQIYESNSTQGFLKECRVGIVTD